MGDDEGEPGDRGEEQGELQHAAEGARSGGSHESGDGAGSADGAEELLDAKGRPGAGKTAKGADHRMVRCRSAATEGMVQGEGAAGRGESTELAERTRGNLRLVGDYGMNPRRKPGCVALEGSEAIGPAL